MNKERVMGKITVDECFKAMAKCLEKWYKFTKSKITLTRRRSEMMKKLYTILLAIVGCSITQGLIASEGQQQVFFDQQTQNNFKLAARDYAGVYGVAWGLLNTHNILQVMIHKDQSLMHRKWLFMPEEYGKYPKGSSKIGNIFKGNTVICKSLLKTVPKTFPIAVIAAFVWNGYQQSISQ